jgi:hypothetical protein
MPVSEIGEYHFDPAHAEPLIQRIPVLLSELKERLPHGAWLTWIDKTLDHGIGRAAEPTGIVAHRGGRRWRVRRRVVAHHFVRLKNRSQVRQTTSS